MSHSELRDVSSQCRDLVISLDVSVRHRRHPDYVSAAAPSIQPIILAALEEAADAGWTADEPTDFATLWSRGQVRTTNTFLRWRVSTVTIRMTRTGVDRRLIPHG